MARIKGWKKVGQHKWKNDIDNKYIVEVSYVGGGLGWAVYHPKQHDSKMASVGNTKKQAMDKAISFMKKYKKPQRKWVSWS